MHASGWVHGDVSLGNILLYEDWAKISDLEHATREGEREEHDRMVRVSSCGEYKSNDGYRARRTSNQKRSDNTIISSNLSRLPSPDCHPAHISPSHRLPVFRNLSTIRSMILNPYGGLLSTSS